jgi:beta-lactamase regulating signal transducer with metallopeptidase domain
MYYFPIAGVVSWLLAHAAFAAPDAFRAFAQIAASAAVAALWQGALIATGLAICLRFAPRISAAHGFGAWASAFAVLVGLDILPFLAHFTSKVEAVSGSAGPSSHSWLELDARWSLLFAAVWVVLAAIRGGGLVLHALRLRRLWKSATPVEDSRVVEFVAGLGHKRVQVCTTPELDRPSVIGFFAPRVLIPDWLYARLMTGELEQVILHETEHLRRRDDWTNLLQKLCLVLFPLNPALAWIERRLCREREMACDEGVIRVTGAPRSYAACLASLAERRLQRRSEVISLGALSLGAFERRPELVNRVHSILLKKNVLGPIGARALLGMVGCGLLAGSVELAHCPQVVAFVPEHRQVAAEQMAQQADWAEPVAAREAMPEFHATNVEAILPAAPRRPTSFHAIEQRETKRGKTSPRLEELSAHLGATEPRQQLLKAVTPEPRAAQSAQPQEWVVFTAWQVQSPAQKAGETADYDTAAQAAGATNATTGEPSQAPSRITVTQLIFTVSPPNRDAKPAPDKDAPAAHSTSLTQPVSNHPAPLPFDGGWLVIQL